MGVFASAVLLYGMSLVYGLGGTRLEDIGGSSPMPRGTASRS